MDKYHIYEEIGKGEFSQVFKGREKKKIEYVAIKRIEKSVMTKIVSEVQTMHKLSSAHILKFYDWYETRNNLWLILEYCTGGDLESILKQDGHLPETSVRIFGLDILASIKYLHALGLIHCDIRPRNFLVDEYGILKLSDFKLVQKIPSKALGESELPLELRGCPPYMAPEIFTPEGVHSYQSDFWSLGCVLYELRRGVAPFGDQECTVGELVERMRSVEPVSAPILFKGKDAEKRNAAIPSLSAELADLLLWLLEKGPANRCSWVELAAHPFWANNKPAPPTNLPVQHVFEAMVREQERSRSLQLEMAYNLEFGVVMNGSGGKAVPQSSTPLKLPLSESTPIRPAPASRQPVEAPGVTSPSSAADDKNVLTRKDLRTANMESSAKIIANIESKWGDSKQQESKKQQQQQQTGLTRVPSDERIINLSLVEEKSVVTTQAAFMSPQKKTQLAPSAAPQAKESLRPSSARNNEDKGPALEDKSSVASSPMKMGRAGPRSGASDGLSVASLLSHPSDVQVKPIVGNKNIEAVDRPSFNGETLTFDVLSAEDLQRLNPSDVEYHMAQVYKALSKVSAQVAQTATPSSTILSALQDRVNILGYLCSVASCPEAANTVLNTSFLGLILKLMKPIPQYSTGLGTTQTRGGSLASTARTASNHVATLTTNVIAVATASRTLSATVLAMMLRFATFIVPPAIRLREEHIVSSIVALLRETGKMDPKFKRRAVAALGETIFYITAQDESGGSALDENGNAVDKWVLPNSAIETLGRCLRDDGDEIVRHYAAKTIENVFAQGGLEFRRRFTTFDIAVRLLELSQTSKSEHLQATCGMALSHMFMFIMVPNNLPPSTGFNGELSSTATTTTTTTPATKKGLGGTLSSTGTLIPDPFVYPIPVSGAKFIAKVLEKGGLAGIIETLRDGQPKLQQAYLSILNTVFAAPIVPDEVDKSADGFKKGPKAGKKGTEEAKQPADAISIAQACNVSLRMTRSYFLKSNQMIATLIKLIDQGATSAVRGKAFLAAQLVCRHSPVSLESLAERRLPSILVKLVEPILSQMALDGPGAAPADLSYVSKTAISMINYIREVCEDTSKTIGDMLGALVHSGGAMEFVGREEIASSHKTPDPSPDKTAALKRRTPQSAGPLKGTPAPVTAAPSKNAFDTAKLKSTADLLVSALSIASPPGLRKLIFALDGQFLLHLSGALSLLPLVHEALEASGSVQAELEYVMERVEQTCLMALETVSQVDLCDDGTSAGPPSLSTNNRNNMSPPPKATSAATVQRGTVIESLHSEEGWERFGDVFVSSLVPAVCQLVSHRNGDVRVVVANSLRRVIPSSVRLCLLRAAAHDTATNQQLAADILRGFVSCLPSMLSDKSPIPQYATRALSDVLQVSKGVALTVVQELNRTGLAGMLVQMLKQSDDRSAGSDNDEEEGFSVDPQLVVLLRNLFEFPEGAVLLLESDVASYIASALSSVVSTSFDPASEGTTELTQVLIDLLYVTLHFVIQALTRVNDNEPAGPRAVPRATRQAQAEQYRRLVAPLRTSAPLLLLLFARIDAYLDTSADLHRQYDDIRLEEFRSTSQVLLHMLDSASVCVAILFDLFQEVVTNHLLAKASVHPDSSTTATTIAGYQGSLSPRMVLAKVLGNALVDFKVRTRLLKIVLAVARLTAASNVPVKAKEFVLQEPIFSVLQRVIKSTRSDSAGDGGAFVKLSQQLLEYVEGL